MDVLKILPLVLFLYACGGDSGVTPTPPNPTPEPSASPSPAPEFPQVIFPVRASGTNFIDGTGRSFWRWGAWDLYGPGWTLPNYPVLEKLARHGVNWVGLRPGPQAPDGPDGMHAPPNLFTHLSDTMNGTSMFGQVAEVAIFDLWVIQHGYSYFPEWDFSDFQGRDLTDSQRAWVTQLLEQLRGWRNVVLLDGNEMFKARPSVDWFKALRREVKSRLPGTLLCTNSEDRLIEREADCVLIHQDGPVGVQAGRPTGVNESGPMLTALDLAKASQYARRQGTFFDFWRGEMTDEEWNLALQQHAAIRRASGK